ncbi:4-coumarate--CoA ligase 3 [Aphelenchoides besseyi]|nr:4-coumarate--CoA ligase 3 [Aphelenchoides besseyi]
MPLNSPFPKVAINERPFTVQLIEKIYEYGQQDTNKLALIDAHNPSDGLTYRTLYSHIHSLVAFLKSRSFKNNDVACIATTNCWQFAVTTLAVTTIGGALSPASYAFTACKGETNVNRAQTSNCGLRSFSDLLSSVRKAVEKSTKVKTVVIINNQTEEIELKENEFFFTQTLRFIPDFTPTPHLNSKQHCLLIPYSSGTTGLPKGVVITHYNMSSIIGMYNEYYAARIWPKIDPNFERTKEKMLVLLPLYHLYGLFLMLKSLLNGMTVILMRRFDEQLFCRCIQDYKIRMLFLVPPIVLFLANSHVISRYDLSSLKWILTGAAPCGQNVINDVHDRLPNLKYIVQGYGMTETTVASHFPVILNTRTNSANVGIVAPNMQQMIIDVKTGKELTKPGERGEIVVRGPNIMLGYLNRPKETAATIRNGWLHTGDIGYVDEQGLLYIVDRLKELIKVKGLQVPPAELEDLLLSHPRIADAAVIGVKDEKAGELPKAFVVRKDESLTEKEVFDFVAERVAHYKQLKGGIHFLQTIPRSAAGKILRKDLRDQEAKL